MQARRQYELVYILPADITEQQVTDLHGQVEAIVSRFGGSLDASENWGRRKLAYVIGRHREGTYLLDRMSGSGDMVKELDRRLRVVDEVIRHAIIRVDEELRVAERTRQRRKEESERRRAARGLPPQGEAAARTPEPAADEDRGEEAEG
jgi:small subunit ribosomal protein S6